MKSEAQRSASTIEVNDFLEVITQNNFSNFQFRVVQKELPTF
jgi:hypothetical protein